MNKINLIKLFFFLLIFFISLGIYNISFAKEDGAPSGNTGSPGDDQTCAHVDCHTGSASHRDSLISTNIPESGYLADVTYLITVFVADTGITKFGFQASPQNLEGSKRGEMELINSLETKETGGGKYVTHTLSGTAGEGSRTWTFNWIPEESSGDITFYVAVNVSNDDEHATGDKIYTSSVVMHEDSTNISLSVEELNKIKFDLISPVFSELILNVATPINTPMQICIIDMNGKLIIQNENSNSNGTFTLPVENLMPGIYFVSIINDKGKLTKQFVKI